MNRPNEPRAYVSLNKNELRKYDRVNAGEHGVFRNVVFLSDGDEFEFGLDNPTDTTYLAKIKLNGDYISDKGLVLRPGEHVFLERYLDEQKRFRFETYEIPKRNSDAVEDNGLVEVEFYKEKVSTGINLDKLEIGDNDDYIPNERRQPWRRSPWRSPWRRGDPVWMDEGNDPVKYNSSGDLPDAKLSADANSRSLDMNVSSSEDDSSMETGRVEKGSRSNQQFRRTDKSFQTFTSCTTKIKILPESAKPYASQDIANYCSRCGKKLKDNWNNCPQCGKTI